MNFCLCDDVREFTRIAPCSLLDARYIPGPFPNEPRRAVVSAEKGGSALGDGERDAGRQIFEQVGVFDFVPGRCIELRHSLEDALRDVGSRTGLENALHVVAAPVRKRLVLYHSRYIEANV
jgi:hypothetical protein